ncbi:hypothetical protein [Peptoniphilus sp. HCN-40583]|uniref:hypothetical protein n=1 Tax=Peptoniphilus sp. HCN-40583 TaxID=3134662 RepID=UPI0030C10D64
MTYTISVERAAEILGKPATTIRTGLQQGVFPFGAAIEMKGRYSYVIYKKKMEDYVGKIDTEESTSTAAL